MTLDQANELKDLIARRLDERAPLNLLDCLRRQGWYVGLGSTRDQSGWQCVIHGQPGKPVLASSTTIDEAVADAVIMLLDCCGHILHAEAAP